MVMQIIPRVVLVVLLTGACAAYGNVESKTTNEAGLLIGRVSSDASANAKAEDARALWNFVLDNGTTWINEDQISEITALLKDDVSAVRVYAASILAEIGPRARRAIPVLENALILAQSTSTSHLGFSSLPYETYICVALDSISGKVPKRCQNWSDLRAIEYFRKTHPEPTRNN